MKHNKAPIIRVIRFEPQIYEGIQIIAQEQDRPVSRVIRSALQEWLQLQTSGRRKSGVAVGTTDRNGRIG
jgi:predicted transcriptional regulator